MGGILGGISAIQQEYETSLESSYDSGSVTTDEVEVEDAPAANSTDEAAEAPQAPVDSAQE